MFFNSRSYIWFLLQVLSLVRSTICLCLISTIFLFKCVNVVLFNFMKIFICSLPLAIFQSCEMVILAILSNVLFLFMIRIWSTFYASIARSSVLLMKDFCFVFQPPNITSIHVSRLHGVCVCVLSWVISSVELFGCCIIWNTGNYKNFI